MIRLLVTIFAGLLGLAFGSFVNVCVSRWPAGESVVRPGSHCRQCARNLSWWENVPVVSWLALRGRCRTCGVRIGVRYVLTEAAVGLLWASAAWSEFGQAALDDSRSVPELIYVYGGAFVASALLYWLLVALAALDAESFWLPDWLTLPGIVVGVIAKSFVEAMLSPTGSRMLGAENGLKSSLIGCAAGAAIVLVIRLIYWLVRRKEGIGLGDAKLMAMLGAWLGFSGALLAFGIGVILGAIAAVVLLLRHRAPQDSPAPTVWASGKLPLGTFLCIGGIISSLWGEQIVTAYLAWAGF